MTRARQILKEHQLGLPLEHPGADLSLVSGSTSPPVANWAATFVTELSRRSVPKTNNPWRDQQDDDAFPDAVSLRRQRLAHHLSVAPDFVLVGEAPGYRGCRVSGIPFTDESLLGQGVVPRVPATERLSTQPACWREPSAQVVWRTMIRAGAEQTTWLWNAFAFHPFSKGPYTNRAPAKQEVDAHLDVLLGLIHAAAEARGGRKEACIVAVGRKASEALGRLNVAHQRVRHPSHGGATEFSQQAANIFAREQGAATRGIHGQSEMESNQ